MSEQLHTAREVATELGLGAAMLRRYASTYEAVSGDVITVHRRDGRLFTGEQLAVLRKARALVMRTNTDVETAIKTALEQPVTGDTVALAQSSALEFTTLLQALTDANKAATKPLLDEMKLLREQVEKQSTLIAELAEARALPPPATPERIDRAIKVEMQAASDDGLMVKAARWLERRLRRK